MQKKLALLFAGLLLTFSPALAVKTNAATTSTSNQATVKNYQNPKRYHQISYTQIRPYGKVGYTLRRGFEGIKTWKVMHRLGTWNGRNYYNQATYYAVKRFQRRHHLRATGNVNLATWQKMGFSKSSWYGIDSYVAPLGAKAGQGHNRVIESWPPRVMVQPIKNYQRNIVAGIKRPFI